MREEDNASFVYRQTKIHISDYVPTPDGVLPTRTPGTLYDDPRVKLCPQPLSSFGVGDRSESRPPCSKIGQDSPSYPLCVSTTVVWSCPSGSPR